MFLARLFASKNHRRYRNIVSLLDWHPLDADLRMGEATTIIEEAAFVVEKATLVV